MTDKVAGLDGILEKIEAERAIERLIYNYGHVLDFDTPDAYADLFAPDGSIEIQSSFANNFGLVVPIPYEKQGLEGGGRLTEKGIVFSGRDVLKRFAVKSGKSIRFLHVASQPVVTLIDDERAEALSYMRVYVQEFSDQPQLQGFGRYIDHFVKIGGHWRIQARVCEV